MVMRCVRPCRRAAVRAGGFDVRHDLVDSVREPAVGQDMRSIAAERTRVALHHAKVGADVWSQVSLVDDQQIGKDQAGAALAWDLVAAGDVDHVQIPIGELRAEGKREVVSPTLDECIVAVRMRGLELFEHREIHRWVFANCCVGTCSGLDPRDPALVEDPGEGGAHMNLIFSTEDVVGHHEHLATAGDQPRYHLLDQRRLAGTNRSTDTNAKWPAHDANILAAERSWRATPTPSWEARLRILCHCTHDARPT